MHTQTAQKFKKGAGKLQPAQAQGTPGLLRGRDEDGGVVKGRVAGGAPLGIPPLLQPGPPLPLVRRLLCSSTQVRFKAKQASPRM
jgi:hypothetical protein